MIPIENLYLGKVVNFTDDFANYAEAEVFQVNQGTGEVLVRLLQPLQNPVCGVGHHFWTTDMTKINEPGDFTNPYNFVTPLAMPDPPAQGLFKKMQKDLNDALIGALFPAASKGKEEEPSLSTTFLNEHYSWAIAPPSPHYGIKIKNAGGPKPEEKNLPKKGEWDDEIHELLVESTKELEAKEKVTIKLPSSGKEVVIGKVTAHVDLAAGPSKTAITIMKKHGKSDGMDHLTEMVYLTKGETEYAKSLWSKGAKKFKKKAVLVMMANKKKKPGALVVTYDELKEHLDSYPTYEEFLKKNKDASLPLMEAAANYYDEKGAISNSQLKNKKPKKSDLIALQELSKPINHGVSKTLQKLIMEEAQVNSKLEATKDQIKSLKDTEDKINAALNVPINEAISQGLIQEMPESVASDFAKNTWSVEVTVPDKDLDVDANVSVSLGHPGKVSVDKPDPLMNGKVGVVGAAIVAIRKATAEEVEEFGWIPGIHEPTVIELSNGVVLLASDPGMNTPLDIFASYKDTHQKLSPPESKSYDGPNIPEYKKPGIY